MEMEKVLREQAKAMGQDGDMMMKAQKVLEINGDHPVFAGLKRAFDEKDDALLKKYADLLYDQAMLIEGMTIEDPVAFSNLVCELMV
jgi:molecular chaperone HtpG